MGELGVGVAVFQQVMQTIEVLLLKERFDAGEEYRRLDGWLRGHRGQSLCPQQGQSLQNKALPFGRRVRSELDYAAKRDQTAQSIRRARPVPRHVGAAVSLLLLLLRCHGSLAAVLRGIVGLALRVAGGQQSGLVPSFQLG